MTLRIPNVGEGVMLEHIVGKTAVENPVLKLFTNNVTPADTDTASTYTEASGNGYSSITLTGSNWTVSTGSPSEAAYAQQTFTFTGALGNVYGYFVVGATSGSLLWSEAFSDGPYNITTSGDLIKVTPKLTLADTLD